MVGLKVVIPHFAQPSGSVSPCWNAWSRGVWRYALVVHWSLVRIFLIFEGGLLLCDHILQDLEAIAELIHVTESGLGLALRRVTLLLCSHAPVVEYRSMYMRNICPYCT